MNHESWDDTGFFWGMKVSLWIYSGVASGFMLKTFNPWWRLLDACAESGCLCGFGFWQRHGWIHSCNLVSPADAPPSFPGTLSEIRVHERHTWKTPEGRGWNEMKWYMSCHVVTLACRVLSWHVGMDGFWLGHLPISDDESFAGTFSRRHRWVFVGPCHLCVHGPPAFTLWFRVSHTLDKNWIIIVIRQELSPVTCKPA